MNPTKTKSAPGLFQMCFFTFCGFYSVPNIFRCSVQSSEKPLRSLDKVSVAGSSCPAVAFGEGRMPLRMASMMSGARLTRLNARKRKARSCLTFCASSETVATLPDSSILRYWKPCITAFCKGDMVSGSSSVCSTSG